MTAASEKHGPQNYVLHAQIQLQLEASGFFFFLLFQCAFLTVPNHI